MKESSCLSADGKTDLHLVYWQPEQEPIGIIQIIHGMAEYIERYQHFAEHLTTAGYLVVGHDHLGHGKSVVENEPQYGYFAAGESAAVLIEDVAIVRDWAEQNFPKLPYYMLGHSMGSFILRNYLQIYKKETAGSIFMGTGGSNVLIPIVLTITESLNRKQPFKVNPFLDKLAFGSFSKKFPEVSRFNWLSKNQRNVEAYEQDELTGFTFTNNGFHTLFQLIKGANQKGWAENISVELPILVISGEDDPVGDFGKGPKQVAKMLNQAGNQDVTLALFANLRHELLFENERASVYLEIISWLKKRQVVD